MPEGDTIFRATVALRRWLVGREVSAARSSVRGVNAERLVGRTIEAVDARAKHLLIRFDGDVVLHTHMRMTGSWHVYPAGEKWRRPEWQARLVIEAGDRVAVCFNAPVVELLVGKEEKVHPALSGLGPDVLDPPLDLEAVRRRAGTRPASTPIGELLLDQRVVSGIGNIWRCETLFECRVSPFAARADVDDTTLDLLVTTAAKLMTASATGRGIETTRAVYKRTNHPCRRCNTSIRSKRLGADARVVYWCPGCQPTSVGVSGA